MSQWGISRTFAVGEHSKIKVLPHVRTDAFEPARPGSVIDSLHLLDIRGDQTEARSAFDRLKLAFVGQPYRSWVED